MKKRMKLISILLTGAMLMSSTALYVSAEETEEAAEGTMIETLYDPNFSIQILEEGVKKVIDGDGRELILVSKELEEVPAAYAESTVIRTPVENAVFLSSTEVCTFRTVDNEEIIDAIGAVTGDAASWSTVPAIAEGLENGEIINVTGGDGDMGEPDYEKIQELNPDVVFLYSGDAAQTNAMVKFDELGINYAVDNEYLESDYLARMEWMRFILTFFDADSAVDEVMNNAQANVDAAKAVIEGQEPVEIAIFNVYDGTLYPSSDGSWFGDMWTDMNAVSVFTEFGGAPTTAEAAYEKMETADIIIYSSTPQWAPGMEAIEEAFPMIVDTEAYANDRIYQYSDLYWNGIDQSDIMATDLAAVFYPELFPDTELSYFVKVEK